MMRSYASLWGASFRESVASKRRARVGQGLDGLRWADSVAFSPYAEEMRQCDRAVGEGEAGKGRGGRDPGVGVGVMRGLKRATGRAEALREARARCAVECRDGRVSRGRAVLCLR